MMINLITHAGVFHADDVFSTVLLLKIFNNKTKIVRTFDHKIIEEAKNDNHSIVYDIGMGEFDHHQKDKEVRSKDKGSIPYAAFGLLWRVFGDTICKKYLELAAPDMEITYDVISKMVEIVDSNFISGIDALDNGVSIKSDDEFVKLYTNSAVSNIISAFNPNWNDPEQNFDAHFCDALDLADIVFTNYLERTAASLIAKEETKRVIESNTNKGFIILDKYFPWQAGVLEYEKEDNNIYYVIFPSQRGGWNIQAVPVEINSFETRKPFPEKFRGVKREILPEISGIDTLNFCHNSGFLSATDNLEDAIKLAEKCIGGEYDE